MRLEEGAEHESRAVRQVVAASRSGGLYGLTRAANSEPESADRQATGAHVGVSVMDTMPEAGRLDAFRIDGFDLWFNSSDHLPPHFHPEKAGRWEVRVQFMRDKTEMIETKWATGKGPSGPPFLTDRAEANRVELLIECEKNSRSR